jgi:hypothetical protein
MASFAVNTFIRDVFLDNINLNTATVKCLLLTSSASPNIDTWAKRSDITNEVSSGGGYTTAGETITVSIGAVDTTNDRVEVTLGSASWSSSTITARYAVYYNSRGGASSADELIAINDFGTDVSSSSGTFTVNASTLRVQNTTT